MRNRIAPGAAANIASGMTRTNLAEIVELPGAIQPSSRHTA